MTRLFGAHLSGMVVTALVDGQLDHVATEHAWGHVMQCRSCRDEVEREMALKRRLSMLGGDAPSARLLGNLQSMNHTVESDPMWSAAEAWSAVDELEQATRTRRRAGLAAAGAGSVSAALIGFAAIGALGGASAGTASIGGATVTPTPTVATVTASTHGHGRSRLANP